MISIMKSIPRLSTFSNSNVNRMSNFSMFKTKAKSLNKRKKNFYSWLYYVLTCKNNDKNKTIDVAKKDTKDIF